MNLSTEFIALAIRALNQKTNTRRRPDHFQDFITMLSTGKTQEQIQAEQLEEILRQAAKCVKDLNTRRKFRKIVKAL